MGRPHSMTPSHPTTADERAPFVHQALLYRDAAGYLGHTLTFIYDGLSADEPVMVAAPRAPPGACGAVAPPAGAGPPAPPGGPRPHPRPPPGRPAGAPPPGFDPPRPGRGRGTAAAAATSADLPPDRVEDVRSAVNEVA